MARSRHQERNESTQKVPWNGHQQKEKQKQRTTKRDLKRTIDGYIMKMGKSWKEMEKTVMNGHNWRDLVSALCHKEDR